MKRIISRRTLREFWNRHPASEQYLKVWYETLKMSTWKSPQEVKQTYVHASILKDNRIVFNVKGNSYRIIVKFNFDRQWAFIRFVGTHDDYDKVDANII